MHGGEHERERQRGLRKSGNRGTQNVNKEENYFFPTIKNAKNSEEKWVQRVQRVQSGGGCLQVRRRVLPRSLAQITEEGFINYGYKINKCVFEKKKKKNKKILSSKISTTTTPTNIIYITIK